MAQKVQFVETVLRDANQSLIATRLPFDKFEPMLSTIDKVGYYAIECWGGATFDVCLRYLNEDPWERLRKIRAAVPNTKLQMLLRGQNVLGYSHYPDDFVKLFVQKAVENGMGNAPICMAKTQYSFSDDPKKLGAPEGFTLTVRDIRISKGAGFIVVLTGEIMTMPGLPKVPAAEKIDVDENGKITGLF